jgi:acetyl-CoA carboxylase carboxyl transferase subunit beta
VAQDPLKFRDSKKLHGPPEGQPHQDRPRRHHRRIGVGKLRGVKLVAVVHEFDFMGGSLGIAAGEAIIKAFERAIAEKHARFIMFPASGGARMQEGILSLMQLPRTTVAVEMLKEAGLPYIVVSHQPDDRRCHGLLRHAGRHPPC